MNRMAITFTFIAAATIVVFSATAVCPQATNVKSPSPARVLFGYLKGNDATIASSGPREVTVKYSLNVICPMNPQDLTPKRIVAELDRYIVGQTQAKRAVAVALRNRYRR